MADANGGAGGVFVRSITLGSLIATVVPLISLGWFFFSLKAVNDDQAKDIAEIHATLRILGERSASSTAELAGMRAEINNLKEWVSDLRTSRAASRGFNSGGFNSGSPPNVGPTR